MTIENKIAYRGKGLKMLCWTMRDNPEADRTLNRESIRTPEDMERYKSIFDSPQELFVAFILNSANKVMTYEIVTKGLLNSSLAHPREIFRAAIVANAASIILAHNHPSGNPEPSGEDIAMTRQIVEAGKVIGIQVHDHVIFADGKITSFSERGLI